MEWAIVGDDEPVPLADRPAVKAIQAEPDPRKALALWAQTVVEDRRPGRTDQRGPHRRGRRRS